MTELAQRVEALLFLAGEGVSKKELGKLTGQLPTAVDRAIAELTEALRDHGLTLVIIDTHVQLTTGQHVSSFVSQFLTQEGSTLSAAAAETLALIAYRGPISRYEIEAIRGVDTRRILRQLLLRGLIGSTVTNNRRRQYIVTEEFLSHLGLPRREDLPRFEELSSHEKIMVALKREEDNDHT